MTNQMPQSASSSDTPMHSGRLTAGDAVDIWIARWLRVQRKQIMSRYNCDARRIYEIWEEVTFPGSRTRALDKFKQLYPNLLDRIDMGPHKRIIRGSHPGQLGLFDKTS